MRLTKSTSHAIRILIDCARANDGLIKVASLSARLEITPQNVFKIVNLLTKAKLIEAVRGRNGGVKLARPPQSIRIGDVVRATEVTHVEIEEGAPARCAQRPWREPHSRQRARSLHRGARPAHHRRHGEDPEPHVVTAAAQAQDRRTHGLVRSRPRAARRVAWRKLTAADWANERTRVGRVCIKRDVASSSNAFRALPLH